MILNFVVTRYRDNYYIIVEYIWLIYHNQFLFSFQFDSKTYRIELPGTISHGFLTCTIFGTNYYFNYTVYWKIILSIPAKNFNLIFFTFRYTIDRKFSEVALQSLRDFPSCEVSKKNLLQKFFKILCENLITKFHNMLNCVHCCFNDAARELFLVVHQ